MEIIKTLRNYLYDRKGKIFDFSYEYNRFFKSIKYASFFKTLKRLVEEGVLKEIGKGVFYICDGNEVTDETIINWYCADTFGMKIGNSLFKELCCSYDNDESITILSTRTDNTKTINKIKIFSLKNNLFLHDSYKIYITMFELLKHNKFTEECSDIWDKKKFEFIKLFIDKYWDGYFKDIKDYLLENYSKHVFIAAARILEDAHKENHLIEMIGGSNLGIK